MNSKRQHELIALAEEAGRLILTLYDSPEFSAKTDGSPVTEADRAAGSMLSARLAQFAPFKVINEETFDATAEVPAAFWLVDPLDGTKEFIKKSGEFTVNIALIENGVPTFGVVCAPALRRTYFAEQGSGAWVTSDEGMHRIQVEPKAATPLRVALSRDHVSDRERTLLNHLAPTIAVSAGSSLKFCLVAEGRADLYPRFVPTMEWDTAAAQCVVEEAGGRITDPKGNRLRYRKPGMKNGPILTFADPTLLERIPSDV